MPKSLEHESVVQHLLSSSGLLHTLPKFLIDPRSVSLDVAQHTACKGTHIPAGTVSRAALSRKYTTTCTDAPDSNTAAIATDNPRSTLPSPPPPDSNRSTDRNVESTAPTGRPAQSRICISIPRWSRKSYLPLSTITLGGELIVLIVKVYGGYIIKQGFDARAAQRARVSPLLPLESSTPLLEGNMKRHGGDGLTEPVGRDSRWPGKSNHTCPIAHQTQSAARYGSMEETCGAKLTTSLHRHQ